MSPKLCFLEEPCGLASQVADVLLDGMVERPLDLADTQVWVPTAGAERRIRYALATLAAKKQTGILTPSFSQPMRALLPENPPHPLATQAEREGAWAKVLGDASREAMSALLSREGTPDSERALIGVGSVLCDLCDLLAEGGYDPAHPRLDEVCAEDAGRWQQLRPLYRQYLQTLEEAQLSDPNALRLHGLQHAHPLSSLKRIVIACIPDLPIAPAHYAAALMKAGVRVEILVWKPGAMIGGFDEWGRPLPEEWNENPLAVTSAQIAIAKEPADEASETIGFLAGSAEQGNYAVTLADQTLAPAFSAEILRVGRIPFLPEGRKLMDSEAGVVAIEWENWRAEGNLRALRTLLQRPHFNRWMCDLTKMAPSQLLAVCDFLICDTLAETLDQAKAYLEMDDGSERDKNAERITAQSKVLVAALDSAARVTFPEALQRIWSKNGDGAAAARQVLEIWQDISASPIFKDWPKARHHAFLRALRAGVLFEPSPGDAVELSGWLEAPWIEAGRLAVCGCVEGTLPASETGHAFLPDSKRKQLGLNNNATRCARDAYILTCLLNVHGQNLRLSMSKFGADGRPALPSRLLLRCAENELPRRVQEVFRRVDGDRSPPGTANGWRWRLPDSLRKAEVTRISPTGFKQYLSCPFRFYFTRVLRLEPSDPDAREMDPLVFGTLIHAALEDFESTAPDETKAATIEKLVLERLEFRGRQMFGPNPAAAVRVQLEAAKFRLQAFARVQAEELAKGWRIIDVERKIDAQAPKPIKIGPLALSAKIDRIEEHPDLGLRILDYKTFATKKTPEKSHLGSPTAVGHLAEARVMVGKREKCWVDLQLPLYRYIAEALYPGREVRTAYFGLPSDPGETEVTEFDLDAELFASALACAGEIASRVHRGIFWPPQEHKGNWDDPFDPMFLNGRAEDCFEQDSIAFLKGER